MSQWMILYSLELMKSELHRERIHDFAEREEVVATFRCYLFLSTEVVSH